MADARLVVTKICAHWLCYKADKGFLRISQVRTLCMCVCVLWLCVFGSVPDVQIGVGMYSLVRLSVVYIISHSLCFRMGGGGSSWWKMCKSVNAAMVVTRVLRKLFY